MNPEQLKALYLSGLTLRQIGDKLGHYHSTIRYHLRKLPDHASTVTSLLIKRVITAERGYSTTRTHARLRRLKLTLAVLRQRRPEVYAELMERSRPSSCPECSKEVAARLRAGMWAWTCAHCGAGGFARHDLASALAAMQQQAESASK